MRLLLASVIALTVAAPLAAQHDHHAGHAATPGTQLPAGWHARVDRDQPADKVKFVTMGTGYHVTTGPAVVLYNPEWSRSGDYRVAASFTQTKAPTHPEAYGIVIGGDDLNEPDQKYSYFLVRGTGEYFIATRKGAERVKVVDWTPHAAVRKQDAQGKQSNVLGAEVKGDEVIFTVNGTEVARRPKSEILTEGTFGFRVNHNLDVHIDQVKR